MHSIRILTLSMMAAITVMLVTMLVAMMLVAMMLVVTMAVAVVETVVAAEVMAVVVMAVAAVVIELTDTENDADSSADTVIALVKKPAEIMNSIRTTMLPYVQHLCMITTI